MNKKLTILGSISFSLFLLLGLASTANKNIFDNHFVNADTCFHQGNHYSYNAPTHEESGNKEFWVCCKCHSTFLEGDNVADYDWTDCQIDNANGFDSNHPAYLEPEPNHKFANNLTKIGYAECLVCHEQELMTTSDVPVRFDVEDWTGRPAGTNGYGCTTPNCIYHQKYFYQICDEKADYNSKKIDFYKIDYSVYNDVCFKFSFNSFPDNSSRVMKIGTSTSNYFFESGGSNLGGDHSFSFNIHYNKSQNNASVLYQFGNQVHQDVITDEKVLNGTDCFSLTFYSYTYASIMIDSVTLNCSHDFQAYTNIRKDKLDNIITEKCAICGTIKYGLPSNKDANNWPNSTAYGMNGTSIANDTQGSYMKPGDIMFSMKGTKFNLPKVNYGLLRHVSFNASVDHWNNATQLWGTLGIFEHGDLYSFTNDVKTTTYPDFDIVVNYESESTLLIELRVANAVLNSILLEDCEDIVKGDSSVSILTNSDSGRTLFIHKIDLYSGFDETIITPNEMSNGTKTALQDVGVVSATKGNITGLFFAGTKPETTNSGYEKFDINFPTIHYSDEIDSIEMKIYIESNATDSNLLFFDAKNTQYSADNPNWAILNTRLTSNTWHTVKFRAERLFKKDSNGETVVNNLSFYTNGGTDKRIYYIESIKVTKCVAIQMAKDVSFNIYGPNTCNQGANLGNNFSNITTYTSTKDNIIGDYDLGYVTKMTGATAYVLDRIVLKQPVKVSDTNNTFIYLRIYIEVSEVTGAKDNLKLFKSNDSQKNENVTINGADLNKWIEVRFPIAMFVDNGYVNEFNIGFWGDTFWKTTTNIYLAKISFSGNASLDDAFVKSNFVTKGTSSYKIMSTQETKGTASYIQATVKKATGAELVNETIEGSNIIDGTTKAIVIGSINSSNNAGLTLQTSEPSSYAIKSYGAAYYLIATDADGYQLGAKYLLEKLLGYDYFGNETYVFSRVSSEKTVHYLNINAQGTANFKYRKTDWSNIYQAEPVEYGYNNCFNGGSNHLINFSSYFTSNGYNQYHNALQILNPNEYRKEFFNSKKNQLCFTGYDDNSSEGGVFNQLIQVMAEKIADFYANEEDTNMVDFLLGQMDNNDTCTCDRCKYYADYYGSPIGPELRFLKLVHNRIKNQKMNIGNRSYDDISLVAFAYQAYEAAPTKNLNTLGSNIKVLYAPIHMDFTHSITDPVNASYKANFEKWEATGIKIQLWLYETNFLNYLYPYLSHKASFDTYNYIAENYNNFELSYSQGQHSNTALHRTGFDQLKRYLNGKAVVGTDKTYEQLLTFFFDNYYKDASKQMRQFFDEMTKVGFENANVFEDTFCHDWYKDATIYKCINDRRIWSKANLTKWNGLCEEALEKVGNQEETKKHIIAESIFPRFALLTLYGGDYSTDNFKDLALNFMQDCEDLKIKYFREGNPIEATQYGRTDAHVDEGITTNELLDYYKKWGIDQYLSK